MYNRYIRNDQGTYTRIPEEDARQPPGAAPPPGQRSGSAVSQSFSSLGSSFPASSR